MARVRAKDRMKNEVNAGSMADIAFLLLIFFLVTTTILEDSGILVKLPEWSDEPPEDVQLNSRNIYSVLVNANNDLLVRKNPMAVRDLREDTKLFITNPNNDPTLSDSPTQAIVSLKNDRGTSYKAYMEVYNELRAAYNEIWDEQAQIRYGKNYDDCTKAEQKGISSFDINKFNMFNEFKNDLSDW